MKRTLIALAVGIVALAANAGDASMKTGFKDLDANGDVGETEYAAWSAKSPTPADTQEPQPTTNQ